MAELRPFQRCWRLAIGAGALLSLALPTTSDGAPPSRYTVRTILTGLNHPWDVAFTPDNSMFVTERSGWIGIRRNGNFRRVHRPRDVFANGEGGMLGIAVDPAFRKNRRIYVCFNTAQDIRVVRFRFAGKPGQLINRRNLLTGIPRNPSGRHSGCRVKWGPDRALWVTTGDAAIGTNPQNLRSRAGKVLRIDANGRAARGNFRKRIYAYGFRNPQGLTFRPGDGRAFIIEHGPGCNDEITPLSRGGNGGWNPVGGGLIYNENVPMTDTQRYPEALRPVWSSGCPTIAPSGGTFVRHADWGDFRGYIAMAVLKDMHLRLVHPGRRVDDQGRVIVSGQGRLRTAVAGPGGRLFIPVDADAGRIITVDPVP